MANYYDVIIIIDLSIIGGLIYSYQSYVFVVLIIAIRVRSFVRPFRRAGGLGPPSLLRITFHCYNNNIIERFVFIIQYYSRCPLQRLTGHDIVLVLSLMVGGGGGLPRW